MSKMGLGKLLFWIIVLVLIFGYFTIGIDGMKAKGNEWFNLLKEKLSPSTTTVQQVTPVNVTAEGTMYGKIPCTKNEDCAVFSKTSMCKIETGECYDSL